MQYAFDVLSHGRADIILAGGVDVLSASLLAGIRLPDGVVPGEGACLLVLERADYARDRGATILAELAAVEMRVAETDARAVPPPPCEGGGRGGRKPSLDAAAPAFPPPHPQRPQVAQGEGGRGGEVAVGGRGGRKPSLDAAAPAVPPPPSEGGGQGGRKPSWGHTFGAAAGLAAAEAIWRLDREAEITVSDPGGQSATIRLLRP